MNNLYKNNVKKNENIFSEIENISKYKWRIQNEI
jgi:hypothetical protein